MRATRGRRVLTAVSGAAVMAAVGVGIRAVDGLRSEAELPEQVKAHTDQVVEPLPSPSSMQRMPPRLELDELQDRTEDSPDPHSHDPAEDEKIAPAPRQTTTRPDPDSDLGSVAEKARKEAQRQQESRRELERTQEQQPREEDQRIEKPMRDQRDSCNDDQLRAMPCRPSGQPV